MDQLLQQHIHISITNIVSPSESSSVTIYFSCNSGYQYGSNIPVISGAKKKKKKKNAYFSSKTSTLK